jgi:pyruvate carboxylase
MTVLDLENLPVDHHLTLPNSVIDMFMGSLGQPEGGWPEKLRRVILKGKRPETDRPGKDLPPIDLDRAAHEATELNGAPASRTDLMSYLMYPDVFAKFAQARERYGDLDVLPTPAFFYGLDERSEITVEIEPGKSLIIRYLTVGEARPDGMRTVFLELNGQPREVEVRDRSVKELEGATRRKADPANQGEVGAPIPGAVTLLHVKRDDQVEKGDRLLVMEAMKMQTTVYAPISGTVKEVLVSLRDSVDAHDLLILLTN